MTTTANYAYWSFSKCIVVDCIVQHETFKHASPFRSLFFLLLNPIVGLDLMRPTKAHIAHHKLNDIPSREHKTCSTSSSSSSIIHPSFMFSLLMFIIYRSHPKKKSTHHNRIIFISLSCLSVHCLVPGDPGHKHTHKQRNNTHTHTQKH